MSANCWASDEAIRIASGESVEDLKSLASQIDLKTLPAGGADFFVAILETRGLKDVGRPVSVEVSGKQLFVCGSAAISSRQLVSMAAARGATSLPMPLQLFQCENLTEQMVEEWSDQMSRRCVRTLASLCRSAIRRSPIGRGTFGRLSRRRLQRHCRNAVSARSGSKAAQQPRRSRWRCNGGNSRWREPWRPVWWRCGRLMASASSSSPAAMRGRPAPLIGLAHIAASPMNIFQMHSVLARRTQAQIGQLKNRASFTEMAGPS